jgi:hypothetical protein
MAETPRLAGCARYDRRHGRSGERTYDMNSAPRFSSLLLVYISRR